MYEPHLPQLAKLAFLASAIHQTVFLLSSTLPFAVGQVQDVGLIFLSAMASSIAVRCIDEVRACSRNSGECDPPDRVSFVQHPAICSGAEKHVGLIFLSAVASSIAIRCIDEVRVGSSTCICT